MAALDDYKYYKPGDSRTSCLKDVSGDEHLLGKMYPDQSGPQFFLQPKSTEDAVKRLAGETRDNLPRVQLGPPKIKPEV